MLVYFHPQNNSQKLYFLIKTVLMKTKK